MKAAVLHQFGQPPRCEEFPDPVAGEGEMLVRVKAVGLENVDRMMAQGTHYAAHQMMPSLPAVIGFDGIGELENGRLVGFGGIRPPYGAMAPTTVIRAGATAPIPDGVDPAVAAVAPGAIMTSLLPLRFAANLQAGQTVLVNGATGFSGRLAVQVARLLGAGRVVGTGRDPASLADLPGLGATSTIDLAQPDEALIEAFDREKGDGYDVIIDYLWGRPTELLLRALTPRELSFPTKKTRLFHIGQAAGEAVSVRGDALRTSGLEILGAGSIPIESLPEATALTWDWLLGKLTHASDQSVPGPAGLLGKTTHNPDQSLPGPAGLLGKTTHNPDQSLPGVAGQQHARLQVAIETVPLAEIEQAWSRTDLHGKRLVIIP